MKNNDKGQSTNPVSLRGSLSTHLGFWLTAIVAMVVLMASAVSISRGVQGQGESQLRNMQNLLAATRPAVAQALSRNDIRTLQHYLGQLSGQHLLSGIEAGINGRVLFRYQGKDVQPNFLVRTLLESAGNPVLEERFELAPGRSGFLRISYSYRELNRSANEIVITTLLIALATLVTLLALMALVLNHFTAPLKPLALMAERLSRGEWNQAVEPARRGSRELQEINDALSKGSNTIRHYVQRLENTREELVQSERRLRTLINSMHEILFEVDADGYLTFLNPAWKSVTGFTTESSLGRSFREFLHEPADRDLFSTRNLPGLLQKNREIRLKTAENEIPVWVTLDASAQHDDAGNFVGVIGTLGDITESVELNHMLSEYQEELYQLSVTDPLTSLYNRRHFDTQFDIILSDHMKERAPLCLVLIDIDGFKFINDTYGHPFGDKVLRSVGDLLSGHTGKDTYLARIGGDEFAMVMGHTSLGEVASKVHRLHNEINNIRVRLPVGQMRIQCSIGVAGAPQHGHAVQDLVRAADVALFQSKRAGRNRVRILSPDTNQATMTIFNKGFQLRDALENGDINPVFQPICDIQTGKPVAYEVLARMMHNDTIIPAKEFITIAEELGLTRDVDLHIIEKALKLAPKTQTLFLNVGLSSFNDRRFVARLHRLLQRACDQGQPITIEITERDIVPLTDELLADITSLREMGCKLALDDFGSGYSTYHFLNFFKPDFIKIEGTFVQGMTHSPSDRRIVEHIHELAHSFGMQTIAENIEDEMTLTALREIGINSGQGVYFGSPQFIN